MQGFSNNTTLFSIPNDVGIKRLGYILFKFRSTTDLIRFSLNFNDYLLNVYNYNTLSINKIFVKISNFLLIVHFEKFFIQVYKVIYSYISIIVLELLYVIKVGHVI